MKSELRDQIIGARQRLSELHSELSRLLNAAQTEQSQRGDGIDVDPEADLDVSALQKALEAVDSAVEAFDDISPKTKVMDVGNTENAKAQKGNALLCELIDLLIYGDENLDALIETLHRNLKPRAIPQTEAAGIANDTVKARMSEDLAQVVAERYFASEGVSSWADEVTKTIARVYKHRQPPKIG